MPKNTPVCFFLLAVPLSCLRIAYFKTTIGVRVIWTPVYASSKNFTGEIIFR